MISTRLGFLAVGSSLDLGYSIPNVAENMGHGLAMAECQPMILTPSSEPVAKGSKSGQAPQISVSLTFCKHH